MGNYQKKIYLYLEYFPSLQWQDISDVNDILKMLYLMTSTILCEIK